MVAIDKGLGLALGRYLDILDGKTFALFHLCKFVECEKQNKIEDALEEHNEKLKVLKQLKERNPKLKDLKEPEYSLLDLKIDLADANIQNCTLCERKCRINRKEGKVGFCGVGYESRVASAFSHFGEEPEFVPSGTLFFAGCNSRCVFCQNWDISQYPRSGEIWGPKRIAEWLTTRFEVGAIINANLVGGEPTPNTHNILKALKFVDVNIPIIWNSNMYMSEECMNLLDGIVDVYLADFKYGNNECAMRLSSLPKYFEIVTRNHLIGKQQCEVLIRHLVLPNHIECCTKPVLNWIKENFGETVRTNIMSQYRPEYKAYEFSEINRRLRREEYAAALEHAKKITLWNIEIQPM